MPLDPSYPQGRLSYMVEDSKMKVLLSHHGLHENLATRPSAVVQLDSDWNKISNESSDSANLPGAESQSSGRLRAVHVGSLTGKPKAAMEIQHSAIVNFLLSMQREPGFT